MASLADLYSFQAMVWMYINAATEQCAVLRIGGDDISVAVVGFGHVVMSCPYWVVPATPSTVRESVWLV
jgi:hypothetical protein